MFVLHTPHELFDRTGAPTREDIITAAFATLDSVLAEPIEQCLYRNSEGQPCIEVNTTVDIASDLNIPTGNIFHTPLEWPWAQEPSQVGTWGVETDHPRIVMGGSGARRGGGVSGVPGHNAAQYILGR
jgi:phytoene dehydrogenase-like protein